MGKMTHDEIELHVRREADKILDKGQSERQMLAEMSVRMKLLFGNGSPGWCAEHEKRIRKNEIMLATYAGGLTVVIFLSEALPRLFSLFNK